MKIGVLSDIHGNLRALEAVLGAFRLVGVERIICLGDMIGYYHQSADVLNLLMRLDIESILGNHEAYLLGYLSCSPERLRVYFLDKVKQSISSKHLEWLSTLPKSLEINIDGKDLAFFHGSPWDPLEDYIYPDSDKFHKFAGLRWDYIFLGHTHYPMLKKVGNLCIVNPGSCGQPRDGDLRASAAVFDLDKEQIFFIRESYNIKSMIEEARSAGVAPEVIKTLDRDGNHGKK